MESMFVPARPICIPLEGLLPGIPSRQLNGICPDVQLHSTRHSMHVYIYLKQREARRVGRSNLHIFKIIKSSSSVFIKYTLIQFCIIIHPSPWQRLRDPSCDHCWFTDSGCISLYVGPF